MMSGVNASPRGAERRENTSKMETKWSLRAMGQTRIRFAPHHRVHGEASCHLPAAEPVVHASVARIFRDPQWQLCGIQVFVHPRR
jgi:hypothetical protein